MEHLPFIPYGRHLIEDDDIAEVARVLRSDFLTTGPEVGSFEQQLCDYTGARFAVAVSNGTAALHLAVLALDIKAGSVGVTSPNTFVATSNALLYADLVPAFVDTNPRSYVMDPDRLQQYMSNHDVAVVLPVHFAGNTAHVDEVSRIARSHGAYVIEDAAHSIGGRYRDGSVVGSCVHSEMTIFSFHPVKTMTTAEGGAITTNDPELYKKLIKLRSHGITKVPDEMGRVPGPWYYEMQLLGFNYRMTDIQGALGKSQLTKLDRFVQRRRELVGRYNEAFRDVPWLTTPWSEPSSEIAWHLYMLLFDWETIGMDRPAVMSVLRENGVGTQVLYIPVPEQPYYRDHLGYSTKSLPNAVEVYEHALAIPLFPRMSDEDQHRVIDAVKKLA